jgi:opacity protein-like surface antigen
MKLISLIYIYSLLFPIMLIAQDYDPEEEDETLGEKIISKFYNYPKLPDNQITLDLVYGFSSIDMPSGFEGLSISKTYDLEFRYGFTRINDEIGIPGRFYYASEYALLSNSSSFLKPKTWLSTGINIDSWRFGIAYKNGYGYMMPNQKRLTLYHSGMLTWTSIDFEQIPVDDFQRNFVRQFDEKIKFGMSYEGGILYNFYKNFNLNLAYEQSIHYPYHEFMKWTGAATIDLIFHRTVDYLGDDLLEQYPDLFPFINFLIKNGYSYIVYRFREDSMYWPFTSSPSLGYDHFKLGITIIF